MGLPRPVIFAIVILVIWMMLNPGGLANFFNHLGESMVIFGTDLTK